ncbi:hypothetical protein [Streptomyces sp. AC602_WCS936]|uniref:hypothetical protein n=1 Tax=Streptomyces sp. AC602_WCS936 TaxID=2823685 RepID=UPI0027E4ED2A|nr:hypothetical protein [Streptomyces sp. AC602_WCS936]
MRVCRHCDQPITAREDAVLVAHEPGNSGPGWNVWAHQAHADRMEPYAVAVRAKVRTLLARTFPQSG